MSGRNQCQTHDLQRPAPMGAMAIEKSRQRGLKPSGPIIVSFVGQTPWDAVHVHCKSGQRYRWDWSECLPLTIVMAPGIDAGDAIRGCFWPWDTQNLLTLVDIELQRVACVIDLLPKPKLWHREDVSDFFPQAAPIDLAEYMRGSFTSSPNCLAEQHAQQGEIAA